MAEYKQVSADADPSGGSEAQTDESVLNSKIDWPRYSSLGIDTTDTHILQKVHQTVTHPDLSFKTDDGDDPRSYVPPPTIAKTLIKCAKKITQTGPPAVYLTLTECFIKSNPNAFVPLFKDDQGFLDLAPFLRYTGSGLPFVSKKATMVCAYLVSVNGIPMQDEHRKTLVSWLVNGMEQGGGAVMKDTLQALMIVLRNNDNRGDLCSHPRAAQILIGLISDKTQKQQLYEALFCLWALSYSDKSYPIFAAHGLVKKLAESTLVHATDKIVRMGLSTLRNVLGKSHDDISFNEQMIDAGVMKNLAELSARQWTHEYDRDDVDEDIKTLAEELQKNYKVMSSFERYKMELQSGQLQKGPVHSEKFWSENAYEFEKKEFKLIQNLVKLLNEATEPETLAVACYDVGEFARFHPQGKMVLRSLGGKTRVMGLMTHQDKEVQKQALQASAKLLISNWEHLGA